jgi:hypothetical protein
MRRAVAWWVRKTTAPFLMYFHVWELDPNQPRIQAAPLHERIRQYRNLSKMADVVCYYLSRYRFTAIADFLGLPSAGGLLDDTAATTQGGVAHGLVDLQPTAVSQPAPKTPVSIVVPCFNEELILPYLANTLDRVVESLDPDYDLRFIFVDDGSVDHTWSSLHSLFGERANTQLIHHSENRGVAAAILTGIKSADSEIVCSIDCDCTYDPHQLKRLIPLLEEGVDMVTASPYHDQGEVRNVPRWRLFLSRSLSMLYRRVLRHQLATYTSCFRVYRRDAVADVQVTEGGFLGVAEMLGRLDLEGGRIVECPAVLEVRLLGRSKMKTMRTIAGHLRLLLRLAVDRPSAERARRGRLGESATGGDDNLD